MNKHKIFNVITCIFIIILLLNLSMPFDTPIFCNARDIRSNNIKHYFKKSPCYYNSEEIKELEYKDFTFWNPNEEASHFPTKEEWWSLYLIIELPDGTYWDVDCTFQYRTKKVDNESIVNRVFFLDYFFERKSGKCYDFSSSTKDNSKYSFNGNKLDLSFENCSITGSYPKYYCHLEEPKKEFGLDVTLIANSTSHWIAEQISDGYLPFGLGIIRYGIIPNLQISGNITLKGDTYNAKGIAYFERAYGNFSYGPDNLLRYKSELKKYKDKISNLGKWWLSNQLITFPKPINLIPENFNGYDWLWATFENGWTCWIGIFHYFDFISKGPKIGLVTIFLDNNTYWDFTDIDLNYLKFYYIEEANLRMPENFEITARFQDKKIYLKFLATTDPFKDISIFPCSKTSCGFAGFQFAGEISGYLVNENNNTTLGGFATFGPYRNYLSINKKTILKSKHIRDNRIKKPNEFISYLLLDLSLNKQLYNKIKNIKNTLTCVKVVSKNSDKYNKIQDAINDANNGDTIIVDKGIYFENIIINKSINLIGKDKYNTVIDCCNKDGITIISDKVEISGFTINATHLDGWNDSAIDIRSKDNYIHDNIIYNSEWYGIFIFNSTGNIIYNNLFDKNDIGIWLSQSTSNIILNNNIEGCKWLGIWFWPKSYNNIILMNNFVNNAENIQKPDIYSINIYKNNYWSDWIGIESPLLRFFPYHVCILEFDNQPTLNPYTLRK